VCDGWRWRRCRKAARVALLFVLIASPRAFGETSACAEGPHGADVIAVGGNRFAALAGRGAEALAAWAWRGGRRVAVPFQVDQCDAEGRVVVGTVESPAPPAQLDATSALLLRRGDGGDRAPVRGRAYAVKITDSEMRSRWIYVAAADGALAKSAEDDVDYDAEHDAVHAVRYSLRFQHPQIAYFAVADGKGRDGPNLIDRLKARVTAHVLWGLVRFRRNEEQVNETVLGFRDGPLRVTRRAALQIEIGWGLPAPHFVAEDYFYADHAEGPVTISLPFALAYVFGDLDVRIYLDFRNLDGYELLAEALGHRTVPIGGEPARVALPSDHNTWFALRRDDRAFFHRIRLGRGLESVEAALYYVYDPEVADPPESVRGVRPAVGYRMTGWSAVGRGRHELWMDTYVLDGATTADIRKAIATIDSVPKIEVSEVGDPAR
jgi:hypothetical protein